ncbi:hypothetical protein G6F56_008409 [Rhizopus delemar]|nr:hypothetical protein G6F56_008409 [Rhizopus delemar]
MTLLRANARVVGSTMVQKHFDNLRKFGMSEEEVPSIPRWGEIPNTTRLPKIWGALLLLADITKNRFAKGDVRGRDRGRPLSTITNGPAVFSSGAQSPVVPPPGLQSLSGSTADEGYIWSPPPREESFTPIRETSGLSGAFRPLRREHNLIDAASGGSEGREGQRQKFPRTTTARGRGRSRPRKAKF